jgi:hypothetical protein
VAWRSSFAFSSELARPLLGGRRRKGEVFTTQSQQAHHDTFLWLRVRVIRGLVTQGADWRQPHLGG